MTKILDASCEDKVVTHEGVEVDAKILSEGNGPSEGTAFLDGDKAFYLTSNASDIKELLGKVASALESVASGLQALDSAGFLNAAQGGVGPGPVATGDISSIQSIKGELEDLMERLK